MTEYVENMKDYVNNMKKYVNILDLALPYLYGPWDLEKFPDLDLGVISGFASTPPPIP